MSTLSQRVEKITGQGGGKRKDPEDNCERQNRWVTEVKEISQAERQLNYVNTNTQISIKRGGSWAGGQTGQSTCGQIGAKRTSRNKQGSG